MSFSVTEVAEGQVIEVELTGKLSKEAYEQFVPLTEQRIEQFGKVRMLVIMHDFCGWDAGALWEDIKFDVRHFRDIERLAIVGDSKWEKAWQRFAARSPRQQSNTSICLSLAKPAGGSRRTPIRPELGTLANHCWS